MYVCCVSPRGRGDVARAHGDALPVLVAMAYQESRLPRKIEHS